MSDESNRQSRLKSLYSKAIAFSCSFEPAQSELFFQAGLSLPETLKQAVPRRQTEFLAGRYCVQQIYQQSDLALPLPQYRDAQRPIWPAGYLGSISHTRGIAAAVLGSQADYEGLGLDLEYIMALETAERVKKSILHPDEMDLLTQSDDWIRDLTIIFSFKESLYKALNPRLNRFIGFEEVQVIALKNGLVTWEPRAHLKQDLADSNRFIGRYSQFNGLILTGFEWLV